VVVLMIVVNVAEHCVDLPAVAGRVGDPHLVLTRVATAGVALVEGHQAAVFEANPRAFDVVGGVDADAEVGERRAGGLLERGRRVGSASSVLARFIEVRKSLSVSI
jgi:hypothetical protein